MSIAYLNLTENQAHALGRAIIYQALRDLVGRNPDAGAAWRWFFKKNEGFTEICDLAGLNEYTVRKRAWAVKEKPEILGEVNV